MAVAGVATAEAAGAAAASAAGTSAAAAVAVTRVTLWPGRRLGRCMPGVRGRFDRCVLVLVLMLVLVRVCFPVGLAVRQCVCVCQVCGGGVVFAFFRGWPCQPSMFVPKTRRRWRVAKCIALPWFGAGSACVCVCVLFFSGGGFAYLLRTVRLYSRVAPAVP